MVNSELFSGWFLGLVSSLFGLLLAIVLEVIKRANERRKEKEKAKIYVTALVKEMEDGIRRCEKMYTLGKENKYSLSQIMTGFWDTCKCEITKYMYNPSALSHVQEIYRRFDLVNMNVKRDIAAGAGDDNSARVEAKRAVIGFAEFYPYMQTDLGEFKKIMKKQGIINIEEQEIDKELMKEIESRNISGSAA